LGRRRCPVAVLEGIGDLVRQGEDADNAEIWSGFRRDAADALMILASHVQAIGLSQGVRQRTATERPLDTPFAGIASAVHDYVEAAFGSERFEAEEAAVKSFVARCWARAGRRHRSPRKLWRFDRPRVPARARAASLQRMSVLVELYGRTAP
jgi:site-specific recombinase